MRPLPQMTGYQMKKCLCVLVSALIVDIIIICYLLVSNSAAIRKRYGLPDTVNLGGAGTACTGISFPTTIPKDLNSAIKYLNVTDVQNLQKEALPKHSFGSLVFVKTHKTASSTLQNIILRHSLTHNKRIALPTYGTSFYWPHPIGLCSIEMFSNGAEFDIVAHHGIFNQQFLKNTMKSPPTYITILRNPVTLFHSAYDFYQFEERCFHQPISKFDEGEGYEKALRGACNPPHISPTRNLQIFDLGLPYHLMDKTEYITKFIDRLNDTFHLVLIAERFDESLILMKKLFDWELRDIVYLRHNIQEHPVRTKYLSSDVITKIQKFNNADMMLYKHFTERFESQLTAAFAPGELQVEVAALRAANDNYQVKCVKRLDKAIALAQNNLLEFAMYTPALSYILKPESIHDLQCRMMALPEVQFTKFFNAYYRQILRLM